MAVSKFATKYNTVSAANQAAIKKLRASATKPTATKPTADKPIVNPVVDEALRSYAAAQDKLLDSLKVPTGTRLLCSAAVGIITYASSVWFAVPLIEYISLGVLSLTSWSFLSYLVWVLGVFAVVISSMVAGWQAAKWVMSFDFDHAASVGREVRDNVKQRAKLIGNWFRRDQVAEPVAAR